MTTTLVDTGFLVALFRSRERFNGAAKAYLTRNRQPLLTVTPVVVETAFFLAAEEKRALLEWVRREGLRVAEWPPSAYARTDAIIAKYADRDIDLADAVLIWLAEQSGCRAILTVDVRDFSIYRLSGGKRFEVLDWQGV